LLNNAQSFENLGDSHCHDWNLADEGQLLAPSKQKAQLELNQGHDADE
jgi:hypothetical protein